jgi:hypothetical protein
MQRRITFFKIAVVTLGLYFVNLTGCDGNGGVIAPEDQAIMEGLVLDANTKRPLSGVLVRSDAFAQNTETDEEGLFSLVYPIPDSFRRVITLSFSKDGYLENFERSIIITNGIVTSIPDVTLIRIGDSNQASSAASNVILLETSAGNVFVKGSGASETADLVFEVRDSNGIAVDLQNQVMVEFSITGGPGGGEFLSPDSALTDAAGIVITTINSGTVAGALQIVAKVKNSTIVSAPVPISIFSGLPDRDHFSVVPNRLNFAGYNIFGLENQITAFVGDIYSNPVPNASVQFQSSGGIIAGGSLSDALGRASVTLLSAEPQPQGVPGGAFPYNQPGFALITAQTVNADQVQISKNTVVLFSGVTQIADISPQTFNLGPGRSQQFSYRVSDQNGNPLVQGTSISVRANKGEVSGDTQISLADTQSRAATEYSFVLTNTSPDSLGSGVVDVTVTISVTSQNGNDSAFITGTMTQ